MKTIRVAAVLLFCSIGFFAATVSAQGTGQKSVSQSRQFPDQGQFQKPYGQLREQILLGQFNAQQGQEQPGQIQIRLQVAAQVRGLLQQIREQRTQILQLRADNSALCEQLRQCLRRFQEEDREVTDELAVRLREQMQIIREERKELAQTLGQISGISLEVRSQRAAGQYENIPGLYQSIADLQQNRIRMLQQIRNELQALLISLQ